MALAPRAATFVFAAFACLAAALPAQVPTHAVQLNPSGGSIEPRLARAGDTVHAVGNEGGVFGFSNIYYARSDDGGRTWPVREQPIAYAQLLTGLAAEGDLAVALVYQQWLGPHTITSTDRGVTWNAPVRVSQQPVPVPTGQVTDGARFSVDGTTVTVVWFEPRATGAMWVNRSLDGGLTWQPTDTRLDVGLTLQPGGYVAGLNVFGDGPVVHAVWSYQTTTGWFTYHQRSVDGGATWRAVPQLVMPDNPFTSAGNATTLFVAAPGTSSLLRSTDAGDTWAPVPAIGFMPRSLAVEGTRVLAVGSSGQFPNLTALMQMSVDGGATWLPQPYTIVHNREIVPTAFLAGGAAFVHFAFPGNFGPPLPGAVVQSDDDGQNWRLVDDRVWHGVWPSAHSCLATTRPNASSRDLLAYVMEGHSSLGQGSAGTGGIVPRLAGAGLPGLGRTFALDVSQAMPGAPGAWFATFGATANVPLGAATLYLQQPIGPFGFSASATGTASLPVVVPASNAFQGLRLASQAFVLDPGAAGGFCATRAIETWIN